MCALSLWQHVYWVSRLMTHPYASGCGNLWKCRLGGERTPPARSCGDGKARAAARPGVRCNSEVLRRWRRKLEGLNPAHPNVPISRL